MDTKRDGYRLKVPRVPVVPACRKNGGVGIDVCLPATALAGVAWTPPIPPRPMALCRGDTGVAEIACCLGPAAGTPVACPAAGGVVIAENGRIREAMTEPRVELSLRPPGCLPDSHSG